MEERAKDCRPRQRPQERLEQQVEQVAEEKNAPIEEQRGASLPREMILHLIRIYHQPTTTNYQPPTTTRYNVAMRRALAAAAAAAILAASAGVHAGQQEARINSTLPVTNGITSVAGIKVGHVTRTERPTGCTIVLAEAGAVAGVDVRGSAPGTIETDLLDPVNLVQQVHAVFLSGGSAFGLDVATGVRKFLYE